MLKTAITIQTDSSGEPKIIPCAGRMSQRYNYLSHTLVIEDSDNPGYIYDFILKDDLDDRLILDCNGDMGRFLPFINRPGINFDAPVRVEKTDKEKEYIITAVLAATPGIRFPETVMYNIFPEKIMKYFTAFRDFASESNKGSSTLRNVLIKKCGADKTNIYSFAQSVYENLLDTPSELIPLISSSDDEVTLFKNTLKVSEQDAALMTGLFELTFGLYSNNSWAKDIFLKDENAKTYPGGKEATRYRLKCCRAFIEEVVRKNPMMYSKYSEGLKLVATKLLSEAES